MFFMEIHGEAKQSIDISFRQDHTSRRRNSWIPAIRPTMARTVASFAHEVGLWWVGLVSFCGSFLWSSWLLMFFWGGPKRQRCILKYFFWNRFFYLKGFWKIIQTCMLTASLNGNSYHGTGARSWQLPRIEGHKWSFVYGRPSKNRDTCKMDGENSGKSY